MNRFQRMLIRYVWYMCSRGAGERADVRGERAVVAAHLHLAGAPGRREHGHGGAGAGRGGRAARRALHAGRARQRPRGRLHHARAAEDALHTHHAQVTHVTCLTKYLRHSCPKAGLICSSENVRSSPLVLIGKSPFF